MRASREDEEDGQPESSVEEWWWLDLLQLQEEVHQNATTEEKGWPASSVSGKIDPPWDH